MLAPIKNLTYRRLFLAQVVSLLGTGLATVALGLLAYELAGDQAGLVLGTALAIKMLAYVGVAPIAGAFADILPRRPFLIGLDVLRAGIVLLLPFVDQVWQVYVLIFLLQSSSAAFTPTFQATIPDILPDEDEYTEALSLSRLAYDLESLISPALAAALLTVISFHWLFAGTAIGFVVSAMFVLSVVLPAVAAEPRKDSIYAKLTRGIRIYLATPRLRGLLALNLAVSAGGAMVIVNTVVYVRTVLKGAETEVAIALATFGAGSMIAALALPRLLNSLPDRAVMLTGGAGLAFALFLSATVSFWSPPGWLLFHCIWFILGLSYSAVLTPSGRLLRRSSHQPDRPALFAAQFALSHACWLFAYPLAGWLGAKFGMSAAFLGLGCLAAFGLAAAFMVWPSAEADPVPHAHPDLPADHPHWSDGTMISAHRHIHELVIDDLHTRWPHGKTRGR
jgi:H+ antiporter protein